MTRTPWVVSLALVVALAGCHKKSPAAPAAVTGLAITGNAALVNKNQTSQLTATATLSDGTTENVTASATWSSDNAALVSVNAAGLATALGNGSTTIRASYQGQAASLPMAVALKATLQVGAQFFRLCGPFRARMDITLTEASGNAGMDVTSVFVTMKDFGGVVRHTHTFSAGDLTAILGNHHINAGQSRTFSDESAYPGNVDTADSTGTVTVSATDDYGNALSTNVTVTFQRDGC